MRDGGIQILDQFGDPFHPFPSNGSVALPPPGPGLDGHARNLHAPRFALDDGAGATIRSFAGLPDYLQALADSEQPSAVRARKPFENHAWVAAAAWAIGITATQIPFSMFRETEAATERRRQSVIRRGGAHDWRPPRGRSRRAFQRHLAIPAERRATTKALEPDLDHPLVETFSAPNPHMSGTDLILMSLLWLAIRGEVFWLKTDELGVPAGRDQTPTQLWPLGPHHFEPIHERGSRGPVMGWWLEPPDYTALGGPVRIPVAIDEVVQMKFPHPENPVRGISRISAAAMTIETDLLSRTHNRSLLRNGARMGGILTHPDFVGPEEEKRLAAQLKERHGGEHNAGRTKILSGGWAWHPVTLSPVDLQILDAMRWNRQEILAVMGVPESVLGVPEQNYATQLGQDRNFLEKTILPLMRVIESAVDSDLLFLEPDDVVAAFDLRDVEALRAGIDMKIQMARALCSQELHVPPRVAFETVGLEVDEYPLDDEVLVNGLAATPLSDVVGLGIPDDPPAPEPAPDPEPDPDEDADPDDEEPGAEEPLAEADDEERALADRLEASGYPAPTVLAARSVSPAFKLTDSVRRAIARKYVRAASKAKRWREFLQVELRSEGAMRRGYRSWVDDERAATLARFDAAARERRLRFFESVTTRDGLDISAVLPNLNDSKNGLRAATRPIYASSIETIYDFTLADLGGIAVFEIDDPRFLDFFETRQRVFSGSVSDTVFRNLQTTLGQALEGGETIQQMRARIAEVYDIASGSAKTLTVARTETAGFMNGARNVMFEAGGFGAKDWADAGDEETRVDHVIFGNLGPQLRDFDYMTVATSGGTGRLLHPGDTQGPPGQVINCRCLELPALAEDVT